MAELEQTLVIIKPDGVQRGLIGAIIARFERRGLKIVAMQLRVIEAALAERHYAEHVGKPFYPGLIEYIGSGPSVLMVVEGPGAIGLVREMVGKTNPAQAAPGTIRADFGLVTGRNLIHASDGGESANREIGLFFGAARLPSWSSALDPWILEG